MTSFGGHMYTRSRRQTKKRLWSWRIELSDSSIFAGDKSAGLGGFMVRRTNQARERCCRRRTVEVLGLPRAPHKLPNSDTIRRRLRLIQSTSEQSPLSDFNWLLFTRYYNANLYRITFDMRDVCYASFSNSSTPVKVPHALRMSMCSSIDECKKTFTFQLKLRTYQRLEIKIWIESAKLMYVSERSRSAGWNMRLDSIAYIYIYIVKFGTSRWRARHGDVMTSLDNTVSLSNGKPSLSLV